MAHKSSPGDGSHATGSKGCGGNLVFGTEAEQAFLTAQGRVDADAAGGLASEIASTTRRFREVGKALKQAETKDRS